MMLDDKLAKEARKRGVSGMTRMYSGYHTTVGTYEDLTTFFRENKAFVNVNYSNQEYTAKAVKMSDGEELYSFSSPEYYAALRKVLSALVLEMRVNPKIKM